jgi:antitoxin HicB
MGLLKKHRRLLSQNWNYPISGNETIGVLINLNLISEAIMRNKHKGSTFESFLEEENLLEEVDAVALKRVVAFELEQAMKKNHITKSEMASKINTSRSSLERFLDPKNTAITLNTLMKIMRVLGKRLQFSIV